MSQHHTKKNGSSQLQPQAFRGIYPVWKFRGETLAVLLERFRQSYALGADTKLTYAGRLDPMADGVVVILAGESRFEKDTLLALPKTYTVDILLGVATDTGDPLGLVTATAQYRGDRALIEEAVRAMRSVTSLPYPLYSSVPVMGKPLFVHARAGTRVIVPQKKVTIMHAELIETREELAAVLVKQIISDIKKVKGDFRQELTMTGWERWQSAYPGQKMTIVRINVAASSGTYMRSLAQWIGGRLNVPALAYTITRTQLGSFILAPLIPNKNIDQ